MVNLKYIENPFTEDYLSSFGCFRDEKLFYDCIDRKKINADNVFENLENSFYTYLLTGDSGEWLGYILFHNVDLVNGYLSTIQVEFERLLLNLKNSIMTPSILEVIDSLYDRLKKREFNVTTSISILESEIECLKQLCMKKNSKTLTYFNEYYSNISSYLYNFKEYYYIDIVIALPLNTKENEIEALYYGFIQEVYNKVEQLIQSKFSFIPIILMNHESVIYIVNRMNVEDVESVERSKVREYFL